jgi:PadR family transcriptional regulator, regulatory protein PadR
MLRERFIEGQTFIDSPTAAKTFLEPLQLEHSQDGRPALAERLFGTLPNFGLDCAHHPNFSLPFPHTSSVSSLTPSLYVVIYGQVIDYYIGGGAMGLGNKLSYTTAVILQALASGYQYGFDIIDVTGLPSGTVYPALRRFEETGVVTSRWEPDAVAEREQRSPRRYYELTKAGHAMLAEALKRYRAVESLFAVVKKPKPSDA